MCRFFINFICPWLLPLILYAYDVIDGQTCYIVVFINFIYLKVLVIYYQNISLKNILVQMFCKLNKEPGITKEFWEEVKKFENLDC